MPGARPRPRHVLHDSAFAKPQMKYAYSAAPPISAYTAAGRRKIPEPTVMFTDDAVRARTPITRSRPAAAGVSEGGGIPPFTPPRRRAPERRYFATANVLM